MAQTKKPLTILVHPKTYAAYGEAFAKMRTQGHHVMTDYDICDEEAWNDIDLILGPSAWRWVSDLPASHLDNAIAAARAEKYAASETGN